jgi:methylmalonyl-CoA/ethylmalonyl-CoA epimerase
MAEPIFTGINHICIVTRDIDRVVRVWADKYHVGPWTVLTYDSSRVAAKVDGQPAEFAMRVAYCQFGATARIELIQPLDDRSPYAVSLDAHNGSDHLHHIRLDVADYSSGLDQLTGLGLQPSLSVMLGGADREVRATVNYMSTEADLGFIAEIATIPPGFQLPPADYTYPASDPEAG